MIDLVIFSGHGSGINALKYFLEHSPAIDCACYLKTKEGIVEFCAKDNGKKKVYIIDSSYIKNSGLLEAILSNCGSDTRVAILDRDPVDRLVSVVNTHILWYAWAATGFGVNDIKYTYVYSYGNVMGVTREILSSPTMSTIPDIFEKFFSATNPLFITSSDLIGDKLLPTFKKLENLIGADIKVPQDLIHEKLYNRYNRFPSYVKRLVISESNESFKYFPVPAVFLQTYNIPEAKIVTTWDPAQIGWECGDFRGPLALVSEADQEQIDKAKYLYYKEIDKGLYYISNLIQRHKISDALAHNLYINSELLLKNSMLDRKLHSFLYVYLYNHISFSLRYSSMGASVWPNSEEFLLQLENSQ